MDDLTASEARRLATDATAGPNRKAIEKALEKIQVAAVRGGASVWISSDRQDIVQSHLKSLGYTVKVHHGDSRSLDQRDHMPVLVVSW